MEIEPFIGKVISELRMKNFFTQEDLAKKTDLDRTYISLIERGKANPTSSVIFALSKALNTKPSKIFMEVEKRMANMPKDNY